MFTPKWKGEAKQLVKGARKFIQYKRDLLDEERIGEIESRRQDLMDAIKGGDRDKVDEAAKQLRAACDNSLPRERPTNWFEENVEVMFVAIVIALGLRAYYLQPFRIPTGSMQPTLNGITGVQKPESEWPSWPQRMVEKVLRGRSYVRLVNDRDRTIATVRDKYQPGKAHPAIRDMQRFHFFSRSAMYFTDSEPLHLPAPKNPCFEAGLMDAITKAESNGMKLRKGDVLCEGYIDTGDLVLVNKFAYHFRKPKRGEVFVFDTLGIRGIDERSADHAKGSHYIKRLCGVPGDTLEIQPPHLLVNGKIAKEPGIQRVMEGKGPYAINPDGYQLANNEPGNFYQHLAEPGDKLKLKAKAQPGMREYAALGDNTGNSLDSRYWGSVKEYNLVGPALFALWPFTSCHWGIIR